MPVSQQHNATCAVIELGHLTQGSFTLCSWSEQHASSLSRVIWYGAPPNRTMHWLCLRSLLANHTRHTAGMLSGQLRLLCCQVEQLLQVAHGDCESCCLMQLTYIGATIVQTTSNSATFQIRPQCGSFSSSAFGLSSMLAVYLE